MGVRHQDTAEGTLVRLTRGAVTVDVAITEIDRDTSEVTVQSSDSEWRLTVDEAQGYATLDRESSTDEAPPWLEGVLRRIGIEGVRA